MNLSAPPAIAIQGLAFSWTRRGGFSITVDDFTLKQGERVLLTAPSGAGKSTLIALIAGIVAPQRGSIAIAGTDLGALSRARRDAFRAEHIGLIFQSFNLISYLSALENVLLPLSFAPGRLRRAGGWPEARHRAIAMLSEIGLAGPLATRRAAELSIGQQQRVAAIRAMIGAPPLIIADEPTSALDIDRQRAFLDMLDTQLDRTGSALLMVSHDPTLADRFQRTVSLGDFARTEQAA